MEGETRTYMALLMGAAMAVIMPGFMWHMYPHRRTTDPRVRRLADGNIEAQRREIAEMEALILDLGKQR